MGFPTGLKDHWETEGIRTTAGSYRYRDRIAKVNSPVYKTFQDAGAVLVGKTNLSDLGIGDESTNFVCPPTRTPYHLERTAGGSSGGGAAAVAAGMQAFDWGTDMGGSIRIPVAYCGVLGMRLSSQVWPVRGMAVRLPKSIAWINGQGPITRDTQMMRNVLRVAAPTLRTGNSKEQQLTGALIYPTTRPGQWPGFAEEVFPHVQAAMEGKGGTRFQPTLHPASDSCF